MDSLTSAARAIADEDASLGASCAVEERLLAEVGTIARARRRRAAMFAAAAAALVVTAVVPLRHLVKRQPQPNTTATVLNGDNVTEFFPLGFTEVPVTGAQIVRIEVPRSALRSFGLVPVDAPGRAASTLALADVVVGEDGLARAVRFVGARRMGGVAK